MRGIGTSRPKVAVIALLVCALVSVISVARAAPVTVQAPRGWSEGAQAAPEAQRRAERWKQALGLRLAQVLSSSAQDRFAETIVVFERSEPIPEQTFADPLRSSAALSEVVARLVGAGEPDATQIRTTTSGAEVLWGQWTVDELHFECILAPSGSNSTLVISAVLATEVDEHRAMLDGVVDELAGVSAPMPRFSLLGWRLGSIVMWIALSLALHAAMLSIVDQDGDHGTAGRRAATICAALVALGAVAAYFLLESREAAIVHAGSSLTGLTVWIAVAGISVAGTHFLLASRIDRGVVQSAPSTGAFASGTYARSGVRPMANRSSASLSTLAEQSSTWTRTGAGNGSPAPTLPNPSDPGASSSARIVIDRAELE